MRHSRAWIVTAAVSVTFGCSDPLVDGSFSGDASAYLSGTVGVAVASPERVRVGALWLGYSATSAPASGMEAVVLPVSSVRFPPSFTFDVLEAPPSVGHYASADGRILPGVMRLARFILFDDVDLDGALSVDSTGQVLPPDELVARAPLHLLLFVRQLPSGATSLDPEQALLSNWEEAAPGYQLVELDPALPLLALQGHLVPTTTPIIFTAAPDGLVF
jgi:hypothetical protein